MPLIGAAMSCFWTGLKHCAFIKLELSEIFELRWRQRLSDFSGICDFDNCGHNTFSLQEHVFPNNFGLFKKGYVIACAFSVV